MKRNILIVEDEAAISNLIKLNLQSAGYYTEQAYDGETALALILENTYDLILLDVMLPKIDGFTLMQKIEHLDIPVIFLTAKSDVINRVEGLKLGAEDYIVKPFEAIELLARIETILRRFNKVNNILRFKDIEINVSEHIVRKNNEIIDLTLKEYELICILVKNKNIALTREKLIELVWDFDYLGGTRTVDMHIGTLRRKLDLQENIKTVYKIGYRLEE
ncbi:response regulator transcription factor [Vallitalea guaymasensis]|uniref:response regulator transcription factor n=1 Tax=Vallitalea guaymasensis TaxID=1185412 RepID=UPI00272B50B8|nr:response regulator transcription factor [Vallitalea guaymasensis]